HHRSDRRDRGPAPPRGGPGPGSRTRTGTAHGGPARVVAARAVQHRPESGRCRGAGGGSTAPYRCLEPSVPGLLRPGPVGARTRPGGPAGGDLLRPARCGEAAVGVAEPTVVAVDAPDP